MSDQGNTGWIGNSKAKNIYESIRKNGTLSKIELQEVSGLTGSTLTRILDNLVEQRFILESGYGPSSGGRRPVLYTVNPTHRYALGLDISRTQSHLVLVDMALNRLDGYIIDMNTEMSPAKLVEQVKKLTLEMFHKHGITREQCLGLGIGAVGPIDRQNGIILKPQFFGADDWVDVTIVDWLQEELGIPVVLDNGANTALIAEASANPKSPFLHMLYIHVGVGLRSSMLSDGKIIYGSVDMEGSLGQMIIQTDGVPHRTNHGNFGALESYASIYAIEQEAKRKLKQGRLSMLRRTAPIHELTIQHIIAASRERDGLAIELITQAAIYFGIGLSNLLNILHPQKVVLGGPLVTASDLFFYTATQTAIQKTYYYPTYQVVFGKGRYGDEAIAVGAAELLISQSTQ